MLAADGERHPRRMAAALRELPHQPKPSEVRIAGLLDGLSVIAGMVDQWLAPSSDAQVRLSLVSQGQ
jgi:predicted glycosyltransferase